MKGKTRDDFRAEIGIRKVVSDKLTRFRSGYFDGKRSASYSRPIHENWGGKIHFDEIYELGYWAGYEEEVRKMNGLIWPNISLGECDEAEG